MAKGRKLTTSRSERLLGSYGAYGHSQGSSGTESSAELGEDDVWSMVEDAAERADHAAASASGCGEGVPLRNRGRIHHQEDRLVGGLSLAFEAGGKTAASRIVHQFRSNDGVSSSPRGGGRHMATSAPVNVPDWSKILRVDSVDSLPELDGELGDYDDSEMVPPHEYLAREYAHSRKTAANSVFEGVGRTLKGRDLSRVRDAVWRQTGFDG